ncbi:AAA family ATPase [Rhizobium leguminosarum]|uniref:AAA family ATPase n=1 Tax=Rhizobium leguminosarum TaxID=384 RepID=UPI003F9542C3
MKIAKSALTNDDPKNVARLAKFEIIGLFGQFSYEIPLQIDEHVTAFIAPNGTGKTLCLRLIEALFAKRWSVFLEVDFKQAVYTFTDGSTVDVRRKPKTGDSDTKIAVSMRGPKGKVMWSPRTNETKRVAHVERYLPFLTRIGPERWRHDHSGRVMKLDEIVDEFGERLPDDLLEQFYGTLPPELSAMIGIECKLIETQRLLVLHELNNGYYYEQPPRKTTSNLAITRKSEKIKQIIAGQINAYATLSQSLDRSFPRRVISQDSNISPEGLTDVLAGLDDKRKELMAAGILDTETDEPVELPDGPLKREVASVLHVYAEDTKKKLASLSDLLAKIKLFKKLIDKRFVTKDVTINRKNGIDVRSGEREIPLEKLSSGEQHQLVLFFEMLFEIKKNSLILIDEPELSLHVAWQRQFIGDLISIIQLNKFDVILATHSPQLIGEWEELVVELGDVDELWDVNDEEEEENAQ